MLTARLSRLLMAHQQLSGNSVGTCESFFFAFESNLESNRPFDSIANRIFESNRPYILFIPSVFILYLSRAWWTQLSTCYSFQFSPKTCQTMPLYDYLTPKLDFKCKSNHRQSFLYKGRLTVRTIRKCWIGSSLRIESRIGSSIRNRISKLRRSLQFSAFVYDSRYNRTNNLSHRTALMQ